MKSKQDIFSAASGIMLLALWAALLLFSARREREASVYKKLLSGELSEAAASPEAEKAGTVPEAEGSGEFYKRLWELHSLNNDMVGWLDIPGTGISYPVMGEGLEGEDFYLTHDFRKDRSARGALYTDGVSSNMIYGHNMRDGSMFGDLDLYKDKEYMEEHGELIFYRLRAPDKITVNKYELVSSFTISEKKFKAPEFLSMIKGGSQKEREKLADYLKRANVVPISEKINDIGKIDFLFLVTCDYSEENSRLFVVANKISQWTKCIKKGTII